MRGAVLRVLSRHGGAVDARTGRPYLDLSRLTPAQKMRVGEVFGEEAVRRMVPKGRRIGRVPGPGQRGIDDIFEVDRADVDYVIVEYKFGSARLGMTRDGRQMSDDWLIGARSNYDRILKRVGKPHAHKVRDALQLGRIEKWLVRTYDDGSVRIWVIDGVGRVRSVETSKIIPGYVERFGLYGARP